MPVSEAHRRAVQKYDRKNMTSVACRVPRSKAAEFTAACEKLGVSKHSVLKEAVEYTIEKAQKNSPGD